MIFYQCDTKKILIFIKTYHCSKIFFNHHVVAFFETRSRRQLEHLPAEAPFWNQHCAKFSSYKYCEVMWPWWWESLTVIHHLTKFGTDRHSFSGDILGLVCLYFVVTWIWLTYVCITKQPLQYLRYVNCK